MEGKPICVINIDGFFDGSIMQLHRAAKDDLLYLSDLDEYFHVENSAEAALQWYY
jgi:hypothetical protein